MEPTARKIAIALFAAVCAFSITGCAGAPSEEEVAAQAVDLDWESVVHERIDNEARAIDEWNGKIVRYECSVWTVDEDSAEVYSEKYNGLPLDSIDVTFADDEDLLSLDSGASIVVVGTLDIESTDRIVDAFLVDA